MAGKISSGGGGGKGRRAALTPNSDPNVIPFIDILLVLLIIFMVTAPIPTVDILVDLPPPNPYHLEQENKPTIVAITADGSLYVDREPVDRASLSDRVLSHAIDNNPRLNPVEMYAEAKIFVRADQSITYGEVVGVMSSLKEDGFAKVGIFSDTASEG